MVTWEEVKDFIRSNYKLQSDEGDFFSLVFELDNDRSQLVIIRKDQTPNGDIWIQMASPVGIIEQDKLNDALEMLDGMICGGLIKSGEKYFVRHCMPIGDISPEEFATPLYFISGIADDLEQRFIGGDEQ